MTTEREIGWNDTIENDGSDFVLLEDGEYAFRVASFARARFGGSAKLPACNQAKLAIEILDADGRPVTTLQHNLFMHSKCEGLLCQFFRSISQRKHGERLTMDWTKVPGAAGRCLVATRPRTGKDGREMKSNEIKKFLDPVDAAEPVVGDQPF